MTKKFQAMTNDDLEMVVGGMGYAYMRKKQNGNFEMVVCDKKLTNEQAKGLLAGDLPNQHGLNNNMITILSDVPQNSMDFTKNQLKEAYEGCEFYNL